MNEVQGAGPLPPFNSAGFQARVGAAIGGHWKLFLIEGAILVGLGILAVFAPFIAGVATAIFIGWLFLFAGVSGLWFSWRSRGAPGFWWGVLSSVAALAAGLFILSSPLGGLISLTYVLIAYFVIDGVFTIFLGLEHRRELSGRWQWIVANGVVDLILAAILISGLPGSVLWAIGLIVGVDLIFAGISIISVALAARDTTA